MPTRPPPKTPFSPRPPPPPLEVPPPPPRRPLPAPPPTPRWRAPAPATPAPTVPAPGGTIPLIQLVDAPLTAVIENLARQAGMNYILDPKVSFGQPGPDGKILPQPTIS